MADYSGLTLNQYGVASPCPDLKLIHYKSSFVMGQSGFESVGNGFDIKGRLKTSAADYVQTLPNKKAARFRLLFALWDVACQSYTTSALVMTTGSVGTSSW